MYYLFINLFSPSIFLTWGPCYVEFKGASWEVRENTPIHKGGFLVWMLFLTFDKMKFMCRFIKLNKSFFSNSQIYFHLLFLKPKRPFHYCNFSSYLYILSIFQMPNCSAHSFISQIPLLPRGLRVHRSLTFRYSCSFMTFCCSVHTYSFLSAIWDFPSDNRAIET